MKDDYAKLLTFRAELFPRFAQHQEIAAETILSLIDPMIRSQTVSTILDVGCGTGEILKSLATALSARAPRVQYVGIDHCRAEIDLAKRSEGCEFHCLGVEELTSLEDVRRSKIDWSETVVLCVGHTLPHFTDLDAFLGILHSLHPAYLLIDFYHSWDETVRTFRNRPDVQCEREPRIVTDGYETYLLTTTRQGYDQVRRGIEKITPSKYPSVLENLGFWTEQRLLTTAEFEETIINLGYVQERSAEYRAGYGWMRAALFSWECQIAKTLNEAYSGILAPYVQDLLEEANRQSLLLNFATKVAALVLPFDKQRTFARYISLTDGVAAPKEWMQVQRASTLTSRHPTAHGLYLTLLSQVSSNMVIQLPDLEEGPQVTTVDLRFRVLEDDFFARSTAGTTLNSGYFVIPFYFARLPLFCLVVKFSDTLPSATTGQAVYTPMLQHVFQYIDGKLRASFDHAVLRSFVDASVTALELEHKLSRGAALRAIEAAIANAQKKPWKSWLLTMPSQRIGELLIVREQERQLGEMLDAAGRYAMGDVLSRISDWFRVGEFFARPDDGGEGGHEHCAPIHCERLRLMLEDAKCETVDELKVCDRFGNPASITPVLRWLSARLRVIDAGGGATEDANEAFLDLKSVFCREKGNTGHRYRFSARRIMALCEIYTGVRPRADSEQGQHLGIIEDDPTPSVVRLVRAIEAFKCINEISFEEVPVHREGNRFAYEYLLIIRLSGLFRPDSPTGDGAREFEAALGAINAGRQARIKPFKEMSLSICITVIVPDDSTEGIGLPKARSHLEVTLT